MDLQKWNMFDFWLEFAWQVPAIFVWCFQQRETKTTLAKGRKITSAANRFFKLAMFEKYCFRLTAKFVDNNRNIVYWMIQKWSLMKFFLKVLMALKSNPSIYSIIIGIFDECDLSSICTILLLMVCSFLKRRIVCLILLSMKVIQELLKLK